MKMELIEIEISADGRFRKNKRKFHLINLITRERVEMIVRHRKPFAGTFKHGYIQCL